MTANDLAPGTYRVHAGSADHSMFGNLLLSIEAPTARAAVEAQALDIIAASRGYDRARLLAVGIDLVREAPRGGYTVERRDSGSEDGALWSVLDANGATVSSGWAYRDAAQACANAMALEDVEREAQALRVPMSHTTADAEYLPVLAYRIEQEARAAQRRLDRLQVLAAQVAAVEQEAPARDLAPALDANALAGIDPAPRYVAPSADSRLDDSATLAAIGAAYDSGASVPAILRAVGTDAHTLRLIRSTLGISLDTLRREASALDANEAPAVEQEAPSAVYTVPPRFYADHVARDLPAGTVERETAKAVTVRLNDADYAELLSDARHYATAMGAAGFDDRGLIASARATVRRLVAAGAPANR